jgi:glycerol-3-phosphate dehydrogenase
MYDIIIIGAGINGALLAQRLSKYQLKLAIIEKDNDVGNEATAANSAIIHAGHDPIEGSLKAQLNVRGNRLWEDLCEELAVDFIRNGAFVVATKEHELEQIKILHQRAIVREVPARILNREEALHVEPNLSDEVIQVLDLPSSAIVSPWEATVAAIEDAMNHGVELFLNNKVLAIDSYRDYFRIHTQQAHYETRYIINSAGVYADEIYGLVSKRTGYRLIPRKGEYYVLDRSESPIVTRTIYPTPTKDSKGILVVPTIHKNILIGPSSEHILNKDVKGNTAETLEKVYQAATRVVKNIPMHTVIRTFVGVRASHEKHDFIIEEAQDVPRFINLIGIDSPGLAAAPAISEYVTETILKTKLNLNLKTEPRMKRKAWIILNRLSLTEKQAYFHQNKQFGKMVCRCELISEAEIIDVIHRHAGAKTIKAIKRRVRAGAGRCQGGFCEPRLVQILARELNIDPTEVVLDSDDSNLLLGYTKEVIE